MMFVHLEQNGKKRSENTEGTDTMAERRMFTKKIIDSDAFLDMPLTTQALYFHLNMRADDDGFVNNPKKIQRMIGASDDDLKLLIAKRFVLAFESGVVVVKHWRMHNLLRKDRYSPTQYQEEMSLLVLKGNGSYTESIEILTDSAEDNQLATAWQPDDNQLATQDSIGKSSIGEIREGKGRVDYNGIRDAYNTLCPSLPAVRSLSDARKKAIKARLNSYSEDDLLEAFRKAEASDFLRGQNNRNWQANFDWIIKDANLAKILDGNYDNRLSYTGRKSKAAEMLDDSYRMMAEWAGGENE